MKIYLAGTTVCSPEEPSGKRIQKLFKKGTKLHSYFHCQPKGFEHKWFGANMKNKVDLFLDSGAFSAFTQGAEIDIQEYIQFIKEHKDVLQVYANLDVIGDPAGTWKNQKIIEKAGLSPLPCFHYGTDTKWLQRYLDAGHEYIALGGMVPISTKDLRIWLDDIFGNYLCDEEGMPKVKVHGFGLTSFPLMFRYPWFSVDSTSWVMTGRMGGVYVPRFKGNEFTYTSDAWKISVSTKSPNKTEAGQHIDNMSPKAKQAILRYFEQKGYHLGCSAFRIEEEDYELEENEKWSGKAFEGEREVEEIVEAGLCNDYKLRDELNIMYFQDLEKYFPEWPCPFVREEVAEGFSL